MTIDKYTSQFHGIEINQIKQTLLQAVKAAALITLPAFRSGLSVDNKEQKSFDPVTEADRAAEVAIRNVIEQAFPDHNIIGEEHENKLTNSPFSWIIDPIDGTRSFISGVPLWGTLIGVAHENINFAGIMTQPFTAESYLGLPGQSISQRNDGPINILKTSNVKNLNEAIMFTTTPTLFKGAGAIAYSKLESEIRLVRYGADCYAYCLIAAGYADLVVETGLKIYDIAALIPIIRNAGGIVTNFQGNEPDDSGNIIAAATPELHAAALQVMRTN